MAEDNCIEIDQFMWLALQDDDLSLVKLEISTISPAINASKDL